MRDRRRSGRDATVGSLGAVRFASIALVDPRGWLLLQERDEHPLLDPERWGFPGGGVEPGESDEQAAYRELAEETGLVLDGGLDLFGEFAVVHDLPGTEGRARDRRDDTVTLWVAPTTATDADVTCHEGRQIVFVDPERARALPLTSSAEVSLPPLLESSLYHRITRGERR